MAKERAEYTRKAAGLAIPLRLVQISGRDPMSEPHLPGERLPAQAVDPAAVDRVVDILTRHYAEDRISSEELEARLERAYRAATASELDALVADLPAAAPAATALSVPAQRVRALLSGQEQRVTGVAPRQMELRAHLGYVEMDLTRATFEPGVTEIDVRALMGYVQIRLPADVRVECHGRAVMGFFALKGARRSSEGDATRVVRITGRAMMGFAEVSVRRGDQPRLPPASDPD